MNSVTEPGAGLAAVTPDGGTQWSNDLTVGVPEFDEDHRRFISLTNDLDSALITGKEKPEIRRLFLLIVEDTIRHFEHEEKLFAQFGYPEAELHASRHAQLVGELIQLREHLDGAGLDAAWISKGFNIRYLLMDHLLEQDMKYGDFMREHCQASC